jgi:hypothetical protein
VKAWMILAKAEGWRRVTGGFWSACADACLVHPAKVPWHAHLPQPTGELWCCEDMEQSSSQSGLQAPPCHATTHSML